MTNVFLTDDEMREVVEALASDIGSTYGAPNTHKLTLPDGREVLFRAEMRPEEMTFTDVSDWSGDTYGRTAWGKESRTYTGYHWRPEGFDGNAEVISSDRDARLWWQPPADVARGTEEFRKLRRAVRDLLEFGYSYILVEVCEGADAYGRPIVTDVAGVGLIEPTEDESYLTEMVAELVRELVTTEGENR